MALRMAKRLCEHAHVLKVELAIRAELVSQREQVVHRPLIGRRRRLNLVKVGH